MDYNEKQPNSRPEEIIIQLVRPNAMVGPEDAKVLQAIIRMALTYNSADQSYLWN